VVPRDLLSFPTRRSSDLFVRVLGQADAVLLTDVYAAGEQPLVAADGRALARALRVAGKIEPVFIEDVADLPQAIRDFARDGDVRSEEHTSELQSRENLVC